MTVHVSMLVAIDPRHHRTKDAVVEVGFYAPAIVNIVGVLGMADEIDIADCNAK